LTFPFPTICPRALVEQAISTGALTKIGNLTGGGGLAAAFDGNTNQATGSAAFDPSGNRDGTVGLSLGTARIISKVITTGTNDTGGYYDSAISLTIYLEGSQDNSSWTALGNSGASASAASQQRTITSTDQSTAWLYVRVRIGSPGPGQTRIAEAQFFELV
jgi:hypothetical protein